MRRLLPLLLLLAVALLLAACGGDSEEEAEENVCNAADDIEAEVESLTSLTLTTASVDGIESSLNAIEDDLNTIDENLGDLREDERGQVEDAYDSLKSTAETALDEVGTSQSIADVQKNLEQSFNELATAAKDLFAPIDCPQE